MKGLRKIREQRGLTLQEVEDLTGIDLNTLSRYERGVLMPNSKTVLKIAEALGITTDELLNGPREERWILKINLSTKLSREEFIDMTSNNCVSDVNLTHNGASVTLGGGYYMFEDDSKFEDFISQLREARDLIIESGRKMLKIGKAATGD